jgi:hypothetical protein
MNNKPVIDSVREFAATVGEQLKTTRFSQLHSNSFDFSNGNITYDGHALSKNAKTQILSMFRLKTGFLDFSSEMQESDWMQVTEAIQSATKNEMYGRISGSDESQTLSEILAVPAKALDNRKGITMMSMQTGFDAICDGLADSTDEWSAQLNFDASTHRVECQFVNEASVFNPFSEGNDNWKLGRHFSFNPLGFESFQFFQRLICMNGMTTSEKAKKTYVNRNNFTPGILKRFVTNAFRNLESDAFSEISLRLLESRQTNISVNELLNTKTLIDRIFSEHEPNRTQTHPLLSKLFDITYLNMSYELDVTKQSKKWKATADTGKNAYEFINDITWLGSHATEANLPSTEASGLRIMGGNLLFKQLDLASIAPQVQLLQTDPISK